MDGQQTTATTGATGTETGAAAPATIPIGKLESLDAYRDATAKGLTEVPNPAAAGAATGTEAKPGAAAAGTTTATGEPDQAAAEAEANSAKPDADLSQAARTLRGNRKDVRAQKLKDDNDTLAREMHRRSELRRQKADQDRLDQLERGRSTTATAGADGTPAGLDGVDPKDPEPTLEQYVAAHPTDADPYAGWLKDWNRWDRRREARAAEATRQQSDQAAHVTEVRTQLQARATEARTKYSDYDAVVDALDAALGTHPSNALISRFVAKSKVGGDLAYRLGKDLERTIEAVKGGAEVLLAHIGVIESHISAAAPKPGAAAALVTGAPDPHQPVAAASTASTGYDPKKSNSLEEWRANKDKVFAGARS